MSRKQKDITIAVHGKFILHWQPGDWVRWDIGNGVKQTWRIRRIEGNTAHMYQPWWWRAEMWATSKIDAILRWLAW